MKLDATLKKMGFKQSAHESAVYRWGSGCNVLLVDIYIDDLIITDAEEQKVEVFKALMKKAFDMSDLGLLYFYLGVEVRQDATGITLCQTHYAKRILELGELLGRKVDVVELKVDSKSAIALAKNPVFHERSKHIRIKYHFIKDCLEDGSIKVSHIATTDQLSVG
ncbi:uncharacterized mitochondrial protein AtMg00810-like [Miscanthus floridulus]|uniref:uncharacterized mitochondrial protein AtMg00810-like n=1 Tax=Miscanthus floridulus TaxID=154761 RepID=UPI0034577183